MLAADGTRVPAAGKGSIVYVIAAYNNFESMEINGVMRQILGFEWGYLRGCPPTRKCGPTARSLVTFDAAACFAVRTDRAASPMYALRCLSGPDFALTSTPANPIRSGQAFVSIRTIKPSPFDDGQLTFGGYDCNFYPADGTAWTATAALGSLHLE
jgi:hypothetical protein